MLHRVRRIIGQVAATEKALDREAERSDILHNISACRGALYSLIAKGIERHIRYHVLAQDGAATDERTRAADDLVSALRAYLRQAARP